MFKPVQPSNIYPSFTWPRLSALAKILLEARRWVVDDAKPERGDDGIVIGFRAWQHERFAIGKAAAKEYREWLSITDASAHFIFKLDMMPIRFCRADSEAPLPPAYATPDAKEIGQIEMAFGKSGVPTVEGIFRLVLEADAGAYGKAVYLVHANLAGETMMTWKIPVAEDGTGVAPIVVPVKPVVLPEIEVLSEAEAAERDRVAKEKAEREKAEREKAEKEKAERDNKKTGA